MHSAAQQPPQQQGQYPPPINVGDYTRRDGTPVSQHSRAPPGGKRERSDPQGQDQEQQQQEEMQKRHQGMMTPQQYLAIVNKRGLYNDPASIPATGASDADQVRTTVQEFLAMRPDAQSGIMMKTFSKDAEKYRDVLLLDEQKRSDMERVANVIQNQSMQVAEAQARESIPEERLNDPDPDKNEQLQALLEALENFDTPHVEDKAAVLKHARDGRYNAETGDFGRKSLVHHLFKAGANPIAEQVMKGAYMF